MGQSSQRHRTIEIHQLKMIALILALALVAPSMASPQFYMRYNNPSTVYRAGARNAAPVARPEPDLTDLTANSHHHHPKQACRHTDTQMRKLPSTKTHRHARARTH